MQNNTQHKTDITSLVYGKVPPQAPELEEAVLGALLLERDKLEDVFSIIPCEDCFYVDAHQKIYSAIKTLYAKGSAVDLLTVSEELSKTGEINNIGGAYYITMLLDKVTSSANIEAHARIIIEKYILREIIRISGAAIGNAYDNSSDVFDLLGDLQRDFSSLVSNNTASDAEHVSIAIKQMNEEIERQVNQQSLLSGIDTGLKEVNRVTNGWQNTDLIILAARPGKGKTALVLNFAYAALTSVISDKCSVLIFSLEMSKTQLVKRISSMVSNVPFDNIMHGRLNEGEMAKLTESSAKIAMQNLWIDDRCNITIEQARVVAKKWDKKRRKKGIPNGLIILDYIQLMRGSREGNREQEISSISRGLKTTAKELNVPLIALSQLNRGVEGRSNPRPNLGDLRESGAIEQDADAVAFLYSEIDANNNTKFHNWIDFQKYRNGKPDQVEVKFLGHLQKWIDLDDFEIFGGIETYKPFAGMRNVLPPEKDDNNPF